MTPSQKYIDKVKELEGFKSAPYLDKAGNATIGYGTCYYANGTPVTMNDAEIDEATASEMLVSKLNTLASQLTSHLNAYGVAPLNGNQFDVILDFCYNEGMGQLVPSNCTFLREMIANVNDPDIAFQLKRWDKDSAGNVEPGLVARCQWRAETYFTPIDVA